MRTIGDRFQIPEDAKPRIGGMGEVYRAQDLDEGGKTVAVKLFFVRAKNITPQHLSKSFESKA